MKVEIGSTPPTAPLAAGPRDAEYPDWGCLPNGAGGRAAGGSGPYDRGLRPGVPVGYASYLWRVERWEAAW